MHSDRQTLHVGLIVAAKNAQRLNCPSPAFGHPTCRLTSVYSDCPAQSEPSKVFRPPPLCVKDNVKSSAHRHLPRFNCRNLSCFLCYTEVTLVAISGTSAGIPARPLLVEREQLRQLSQRDVLKTDSLREPHQSPSLLTP
jgi:hypothetical protein